MMKRQRRKFEMFLKVRDFYNTRAADFPADSVGGELFATLSAVIEQLESLNTNKVSLTGDVAQFIDIKGDAKDLVRDLLEDIGDMAATMSYEINGLEDKFRVPQNKSVPSLIATGRAFARDAADYKTDFVKYGLAPDFIARLTAATDALEAAHSRTDDGTQERIGTIAALVPLFKSGMEKVGRLQPLVRMKYRNDAANLSAWVYASHLAREPHAQPAPAAG